MKLSRSGLAALLVVYLVWGSSFVAIRLAVSGAGAIPPYQLAGFRTLIAGLLLLLMAVAKGNSLRVPAAAFRWLALTGSLLWIGGHVLVIYAERNLDSGLAALLFASSPLWAALLEGLRGRRVRVGPVLLGFAGLALVLPLGNALGFGGGGVPASVWIDSALVLASAFFWSLGTVLGDGPARGLPLTVTTGIQLCVAGLVTTAFSFFVGEPAAVPELRALAAATWLTVVGTVAAFLAYGHSIRTLPTPLLFSFGYVNPVVAVALGAVALGEKIEARALCGMVVVIGSVAWLFAKPGEAA